jgi:UDP-N-acetylmuramate dehydrogenase
MQAVPVPSHLRLNEPLKNYTTLRVGGPADLFYRATNIEECAQVVITAHQLRVPTFILGLGSNLLVSDKGIRGLVVYNCCRCIEVGEITFSESGAPFQLLFLKAAQAGLSGLEFAVGIPGTVGGALISNAGAFRENIGDLVEAIDVVVEGERQRVTKEWMQFSYRDSILRRPDPPRAAILAVTLRLRRGDRRQIFAKARELQLWRIERQPPNPSAGSFFKNVYDAELAQKLDMVCRRHPERGRRRARRLPDCGGGAQGHARWRGNGVGETRELSHQCRRRDRDRYPQAGRLGQTGGFREVRGSSGGGGTHGRGLVVKTLTSLQTMWDTFCVDVRKVATCRRRESVSASRGVCPFSHGLGGEVKRSFIMCEGIRCLSRERFVELRARVTPEAMEEVEHRPRLF